MQSTYGMPKLEKQVMDELEKAYNALRMASETMDMVDTIQAAKICTVRKEVLKLLQGELGL